MKRERDLRSLTLEELASGAAFFSSLVGFTLIELFDHRLISGPDGGQAFHFIAFFVLASTALSPLSIMRWPGVVAALLAFGAILENVEIIQTAPFDVTDALSEIVGAIIGALTAGALRVLTNMTSRGPKPPFASSPTGNALSVTLAGFFWLLALFVH
jgi:hypothetical protein